MVRNVQTKEREKRIIDQMIISVAVPSTVLLLPRFLDDTFYLEEFRICSSKKARGKEKKPRGKGTKLHQRTVGCTSLTSPYVNNSLLFLSYLRFAFVLVCVLKK